MPRAFFCFKADCKNSKREPGSSQVPLFCSGPEPRDSHLGEDNLIVHRGLGDLLLPSGGPEELPTLVGLGDETLSEELLHTHADVGVDVALLSDVQKVGGRDRQTLTGEGEDLIAAGNQSGLDLGGRTTGTSLPFDGDAHLSAANHELSAHQELEDRGALINAQTGEGLGGDDGTGEEGVEGGR